eukprot:2991592-Ditylum_brightwellii.AAC.1
MARRDTPCIPNNQATHDLPKVDDVTEKYVLEDIQEIPTMEHPDKSKKKICMLDEVTMSTMNSDTSYTEAESESLEDPSEEWDIEALAMYNDGWEDTWEQPIPLSQTNTKTQSSIPLHTKAEELKDMITADHFWHQVIRQQKEK